MGFRYIGILVFRTIFAQKGYFLSQKENENINIEFCIFELIYVPSYSLNWQFWFFGYNLRKNDIFSQKQKKWTEPLNSEYSNYIGMIIPNSTFNFQPKLTILNFGIKFAQKWYFRLKAKNVSITINFCIYEILLVANLSLNWQLWFFGPDVPKKDISGRKQIKSTSPWNSTYLRGEYVWTRLSSPKSNFYQEIIGFSPLILRKSLFSGVSDYLPFKNDRGNTKNKKNW